MSNIWFCTRTYNRLEWGDVQESGLIFLSPVRYDNQQDRITLPIGTAIDASSIMVGLQSFTLGCQGKNSPVSQIGWGLQETPFVENGNIIVIKPFLRFQGALTIFNPLPPHAGTAILLNKNTVALTLSVIAQLS